MATLETDGLDQLLDSLSLTNIASDSRKSNLLSNPLEICRSLLAQLLSELLACDVCDAEKSIQWPNNIFNGDLSVTLPRLRPGCKPAELSSHLIDMFPKDHALFEPPLPEGVHLRFFLKLDVIPRFLVPYIKDRGRSYGFDPALATTDSISTTNNQRKLVVEFSSPNVTGELQGKHLRSTIIGAFISRLYESAGWDVCRINYLGDWGKPIALLYVGWQRYGSEDAYRADPVGHLLQVYRQVEAEFQPEQAASKQARDDAVKEGHDEGEAQVSIESQGIFAQRNEAFKKLEDGDEALMEFWHRIREANIKDYEAFYDRLGIRFDEYSGESQISSSAMIEIENLLREKSISEESGGAWIVHMRNLGAKAGTAIIRDRSGSSTYLLRDLAAVLERSRKHHFDKMIYVVASDHSPHFSQLFRILEALDMEGIANKLQHVRFSESSKMSALFSKGYKPQTVLNECEDAVTSLLGHESERFAVLDDVKVDTPTLAISALLGQELSTRLTSTHAFDTVVLPQFRFGSGLDLQYWLAKATKLSENAPLPSDLTDNDYAKLAEEHCANLLRLLAQYPEVISATYNSLEPSNIVTYLASVTEQLSECLGREEEQREEAAECSTEIVPGLSILYATTKIVLENGLRLIGLPTLANEIPRRVDTPIGT